jgi:hemoglobin-like flavoprotein
LDTEQIKLVRLSFSKLAGREDEAGRAFYRHLFDIAPELRPLFRDDIEAQSRKFTHMLGLAVGMLGSARELIVVLNSLAKRHVRYGARVEHFEKVGQALILMLEEICGEDFTPQVRMGWIAVYVQMATIMRRAMQGERITLRRTSSPSGG